MLQGCPLLRLWHMLWWCGCNCCEGSVRSDWIVCLTICFSPVSLPPFWHMDLPYRIMVSQISADLWSLADFLCLLTKLRISLLLEYNGQ